MRCPLTYQVGTVRKKTSRDHRCDHRRFSTETPPITTCEGTCVGGASSGREATRTQAPQGSSSGLREERSGRSLWGVRRPRRPLSVPVPESLVRLACCASLSRRGGGMAALSLGLRDTVRVSRFFSPHRGSPGPPSHPPALPSPSVNNTPRAHTPPSTLTTPGVASSRLPPRVPSYTFGFGRLSRRRASGIGRRESPAWLLSLSVSFACSLSLSLSSARLFPFLYLSLLYVVDRFI